MNRNAVPTTMNYALNNPEKNEQISTLTEALRGFTPLLRDEKAKLGLALVAILLNTGLNLLVPTIVGYTIDNHIRTGDYRGVLVYSGILLILFVAAFFASYYQTLTMGGVGQHVLFKLRNAVFMKLQSLPIAFFNQNKAGDLISRINNDTDKLNQFFSQALVQFVGNFFAIIGAGIFLLVIHLRLGSAALIPAVFLVLVTRLLSGWMKCKNTESLQTLGGMSGEIAESLSNFKVIVAFNRRDYFREHFQTVNELNYNASLKSGLANNAFTPIYAFCSNVAQLIVIGYGISLISDGNLTLGILISSLLYVVRFYDPLRQMAALWSSFQTALAAWERVSAILSMESTMKILPAVSSALVAANEVLCFENVDFRYPEGKQVLKGISFMLERGKTYALVGPTGGGKTTTASLMARLYDPTEGSVRLNGRDIRSYTNDERSQKIGFILQEPFLFTGTVGENIFYGNARYATASQEEWASILREKGFDGLLKRFDQGLETSVVASGDSISLGQKQLIAFMRAVLREPDLLILDEATANIDTVTEQLLEEVLHQLPKSTTRVIIAHRLNTIESADEIFFVNEGTISPAGSFNHAVEMLMKEKRGS